MSNMATLPYVTPVQNNAPDYFGRMMGQVGDRDKKQRVQQAMQFITEGKVTENRSKIQTMLSGNKELVNSQSEALGILQRDAPDIFKEIKRTEERNQTRAEKLEVDRKKWFQDNAVGGISASIDELLEIPEDDLALRAEVGNRRSQAIFSMAPKQYGFANQELMGEQDVTNKSLQDMKKTLMTLGAEEPTGLTPSELNKVEENTAQITDFGNAAKYYARRTEGETLTPEMHKNMQAISPLETEGEDGPTQAQQLKINERYQELDTHIENITTMLGEIKADPSLAGAPGSIRKGVQTTSGVITDLGNLTKMIPVIGPVIRWAASLSAGMNEEDKERFGHDPKLSKLRVFENDLAWALARARQPTGRILAKNYEAAKKDAQITGMISSQDVIARIGEILRQLKQQRGNVEELSRGEGSDYKVINFEDM